MTSMRIQHLIEFRHVIVELEIALLVFPDVLPLFNANHREGAVELCACTVYDDGVARLNFGRGQGLYG